MWLALSIALLGLGCELDDADLHCERAITHLASCCEDLDTQGVCDSRSGGFLRDADLPVIRAEEAECIVDKPCAKLRPICDAVQERVEDTGYTADSGMGWQALPVCR